MRHDEMMILTPERKKVITTLEIAKAMGMQHKRVLRKLEGQDVKGNHIKGVIEVLKEYENSETYLGLATEHNLGLSDFFIKSTYIDEQGKPRKCYNCTRKGCEMLAHKFQGEKGILFTALYINRFHEMEQQIAKNKQAVPKEQSRIARKREVSAISIRKSDWWSKNACKLGFICREIGTDYKSIYHNFLVCASKKYDLELARIIYKHERGYYPVYAIDIVDHFPELEAELNDYIDGLYQIALE